MAPLDAAEMPKHAGSSSSPVKHAAPRKKNDYHDHDSRQRSHIEEHTVVQRSIEACGPLSAFSSPHRVSSVRILVPVAPKQPGLGVQASPFSTALLANSLCIFCANRSLRHVMSLLSASCCRQRALEKDIAAAVHTTYSSDYG